MSVTYTDQVRPAAARVDSEAYVPVYARSGARTSNKPVKTWMILAPLGVLMVGGAAAAMLMQPGEATAPAAIEAAPAPPAAMTPPEVSPLTAATIPMETPAGLTTAPIPPSDVVPTERRSALPVAPARSARVAPRAAPAVAPVEAPVPTGPQPYLSVAPQVAPAPAPATVIPPVTSAATPTPIVITPTN